jgi:predicted ABC-type ATPase
MITPKEIFIIAGANGVGKTTFALNLIDDGLVTHYLNADEIATEMKMQYPEATNIKAARVFLARLDKFSKGDESFAFETTLSGLKYLKHIHNWKKIGWKISIFYLFVTSDNVSKKRVVERVDHGGHSIPEEDIVRRFPKSLKNYFHQYLTLADYSQCIYNEDEQPIIVFEATNGKIRNTNPKIYLDFLELINNG